MRDILLKSTWRVLGSFLLMPCLVSVAFAAEEYVVVSVTPQTESINIGQIYKVGDVVSIPAATAITLMGADGSFTTIEGPETIGITPEDSPGSKGSGSADQSSTLAKIGTLLTGSTEATQVLGAARSLGSASDQRGEAINPWVIPVDAQDVGCINSGKIGLRRLAAAIDVDVVFTTSPAAEESATRWKKGEKELWLNIDEYENVELGNIRLVQLNKAIAVTKLPAKTQTKYNLKQIEWMIDKGCKVQAILFIKALSVDSETLDKGK